MLQPMTLEYAAGYLDGEGCFYSSKSGAVCVSVSNTHVQTLLDLQALFNCGTVGPKKAYVRGRPAFQWRCYGHAAVIVTEQVVQFLREKEVQARLLIELYGTPIGTLRDSLVTVLRDMKKVHYAL